MGQPIEPAAVLLAAPENPEHGEIEAALQRAAELDPARGVPPLARYLERQKRLPEAIAHWREALKRSPSETRFRMGLARAYERDDQPEQALATYLSALEASPGGTTWLLIAEHLDALATRLPPAPAARAIKIAVLGSATLDHLHSYVKVACYRAGLRPQMYQSGFDQYSQEILAADSGLYAFSPDVVICAIHASRLFPGIHSDPLALTADQRRAEVDAGLNTVDALLGHLTARTSALVLLNTMVAPQYPALGILDLRDEFGQTAAFASINARLAELTRTRYPSVHLVDEDRLQSQVGKSRATDPRMWFTARLGWSPEFLPRLTGEYMRYVCAYRGLNRKCVVVDLDNTLWGGVIGEDGLSGIQLGADAPGNAYVAFQQALEGLWRKGILLAVCSKNNPDVVLEALEHHPDMVLRPSHFASMRINWQPKVTNIREIARELNIGLDSLVFLDDNPVERSLVRAELPEVLTPELPTDVALYRNALLRLGVFDTLAFTDEDRLRNEVYAQQHERQARAAQFSTNASVEEYLADLQMVVEIEPADALSLPRIAQLTTKTNQFNLTTRRYTEAEVRDRLGRGWSVIGARVKDRFGDNGLTGVILAARSEERWEIDTLLLSCRVMGRGVETALLAHVAKEARLAGARWLEGVFVPTSKNDACRDCYQRHGFQQAQTAEDGRARWELDLHGTLPVVPAWISVRTLVSTA